MKTKPQPPKQIVSVRWQVERAKINTLAFEAVGPQVAIDFEGETLVEAARIVNRQQEQDFVHRLVKITKEVVA